MLKIGDFSKLSRNSVRMLRHYDEIGLLTPEATDAFTGYRYYTEAQLTQANRITSLKAMGFGLAEIAALLSCYENPDRLAQTLQLKCQETKQEMEAAAYRLQLLDAALKQIRKDYTMMKYDVTLKELPEQMCIRDRGIVSSVPGIICHFSSRRQITTPSRQSVPNASFTV